MREHPRGHLRPAPFEQHVRRVFRELEVSGRIYDLRRESFYRPIAERDLSVSFHGQRAGNPLGPAAGPQDQMLQNIVLCWLAGARIFELKTVQVLDELDIGRPCIDAATVGYNVEWSQELKLEQSLREYVGARMVIEMLRQRGVAGDERLSQGDGYVFDLSVGYDLAGIRSPAMQRFLEHALDSRALVEDLRQRIPPEQRSLRDLPFPPRLSDSITLSTFHGCPAQEIERIAEHLMRDWGFHVIVKLNPPQLGRERLEHLLHDVLGYTGLRVNPKAYDAGLSFDEAAGLGRRMQDLARARGLGFGFKFTNTLELLNDRGRLPGEVIYLSGQPLHVLALALAARFREGFGPDLPISFSAGIDRRNFKYIAALGFCPITTCTDLLRPGGYGRLPAYLHELEQYMERLGVTDLSAYTLTARDQAEAAIRKAVAETTAEAGPVATNADGLLAAYRQGGAPGLRAAAGPELFRRSVAWSAALNTPPALAKAMADPHYHATRNAREPKFIDRHLVLFDCITCDKCVPVCPNDAIFVYAPEPRRGTWPVLLVDEQGRAREAGLGPFIIEQRHQFAVYADFCNACGNCDTFCPEEGGPYLDKPLFFGNREDFAAPDAPDGYHLERDGLAWRLHARRGGRSYILTLTAEAAVLEDGVLRVELAPSDGRLLRVADVSPVHAGHRLDLSLAPAMLALLRGVTDPRRVNPVFTSF